MVEATNTQPSALTKHGIKQICESENLADQFKNVTMVLQIHDCTVFDEESTKKNIKARVHLSDGVSRMICLITTKVYEQIVSVPSTVCTQSLCVIATLKMSAYDAHII